MSQRDDATHDALKYLTGIANAFDPVEGEPEFSVHAWQKIRNAIFELSRAQPSERATSDLADKLHGMGDTAYCTAMEMAKREHCLGEEHKIKTGAFSRENLKALEEVRAKFGEANGLWAAEKVVREAQRSATRLSDLPEGNELARTIRDAARWRTLKELAGYYQDGSQTTVKLYQDDALRSCFIEVGKRIYGTDGSSFDSAMDQAMEAQANDEHR